MTADLTADTVSPRRAQAARWAVTAVFFVLGLMMAAWFTQIPQFKSELHLTDGRLGIALLCPAAGSLVSMRAAGRLARAHGSAVVLRIATLFFAATLPVVGSAHGVFAFCAALFALGLADGLVDVSMNAHAVAVERALGRPVLQSMHGAYSFGGIVGALSGGIAIWGGVGSAAYLSGTAVVVAVISLTTATRLLPATADTSAPSQDVARRSGARAGWTRSVVILGLLGAGCLLAGGAMESWGAVFLRGARHAAPALASAGYFAFTATQLAARLAGDRLHKRWGPVALVRRGAVVAAAGLLLLLIPMPLAVAIAGMAVFGLGLSVLVPIIFGAVGHASAAEGDAADVTEAVARFTTLSYLGYLLGPASLGWLAQGIGLTWSLATVLLVLAAVARYAGWTAGALPGIAESGTSSTAAGPFAPSTSEVTPR